MIHAGILSWCPLYCFSTQDFIKAEPADALRTRVRPLVIITCANLLYLSNWIAAKRKTRGPLGSELLSCWFFLNYYYYGSVFVFFDLSCFRPLEPILSENESFDLLKVCVNSVISLPPETHTPEKNKDDEILDPKQRKVFYKNIYKCRKQFIPMLLLSK